MPDPGAGSVAAALRVTAEVYQPFSPCVPLRLPLIVGAWVSTLALALPMAELSP